MSQRATIAFLAVVSLLSMLSVGCASAPVANRPAAPAPSGFLGDYTDLDPGPKGGPLLLFVREGGVLGSYDRFMVDPVLVYFHPQARGSGVDPADLARLTEFLYVETKDQLEAAGYEVVEEAGPRVARVRAAITDVEGIKPGRNLGLKAAGVAVGVGLLIPSVDIGRAAIEVEILDSESGERLVAIVDAAKGRRFFNVSKSARTYGDVKGAFKDWAKEFRQQLDRAHAAAKEEER